MGLRAGRIVVPLLIALGGPLAGSALASGPVGADPSSNYPMGTMPPACQTAPTGSACIGAAVSYLNQARANLGQPPYTLPSDFATLAPTQQVLILTNDDRLLYDLPPISGVTDALDRDAAAAIPTASDPQPSSSDPWAGFTSNAAWGNVNVVAAYEAWMYDDGLGSGNVDCTASNSSGCWGHRHDILWQFGPGTLAMGAATGTDSSGDPAYTMLLMQGNSSYNPVFNYTWSQALADGAGPGGSNGSAGGFGSTPPPSAAAGSLRPGAAPEARGASVSIKVRRVRVHGHRVTVRISAPSGTALRCSLSRVQGRFQRAKRCNRTVTFASVPRGRYRLRVSFGTLTVTRRVVVR